MTGRRGGRSKHGGEEYLAYNEKEGRLVGLVTSCVETVV